MTFLAISSIMVVLIIGAVIIGVVVGLKKLGGKHPFTFMTKQRLLYSYLAIIVLISFLLMMFILPKIEMKAVASGTSPDIFLMVLDGSKQEELPKQYIKDEWTWVVDSKTVGLDVSSMEDNSFYSNIVVEQREDDDPSVNVTLYETPTLVGNIDISDKIPLNDIGVNNGNIVLDYEQEMVEVKFYSIANDVVYSQFSNENKHDWQHDIFNFNAGEQLLYISVPKDITVESQVEDYIYYVE